MFLILLGVALWSGAHLFKRFYPERREAMGDKGKALTSVLILISLVMMIVGYRMADGPVFWGRSPALVGINNLMMLFAVYLFVSSGVKTWMSSKVKNPQLTGFKIWCAAHLLVNGDLPSFLLFGGLLAWAVVTVIQLKKAGNPAPEMSKGWPVKNELQALIGTAFVFLFIAAAHSMLGYVPIG